MSIGEKSIFVPGQEEIDGLVSELTGMVADAQVDAVSGPVVTGRTEEEVPVPSIRPVVVNTKLNKFVLSKWRVGITDLGDVEVVPAAIPHAEHLRDEYRQKIQGLWQERRTQNTRFEAKRTRVIQEITDDFFAVDPESELRADTEAHHPIAAVLTPAYRGALIRGIEKSLGIDTDVFNTEVLPLLDGHVEVARQLETERLVKRGYNPDRQTAYLMPYNMRLRESVARQYVPILIGRLLSLLEDRYVQDLSDPAQEPAQGQTGLRAVFRRNRQTEEPVDTDGVLLKRLKGYNKYIGQHAELRNDALVYAAEEVQEFIGNLRQLQTDEPANESTTERVYTTVNHRQATLDVLRQYGGNEAAENVFIRYNAYSRDNVTILLREPVGSTNGIIETMKSAADIRLMNIPPMQIPFGELEIMAASNADSQELLHAIGDRLVNQDKPLHVSYFGIFRTPTNQSVLMELKTLGTDSSLSDASYRWAEVRIRKITQTTHLAVMDEWEELVALNNMVPYDEEDIDIEIPVRQTATEQQVEYLHRLVQGMRRKRAIISNAAARSVRWSVAAAEIDKE